MMVSRIDTKIPGERDKTQQDAAAAINYFSQSHSQKKPLPKDIPRFDDLIVSLSNSHENRRARQVTEWEKMRQQNFPLAV